ncbi:MAG: putative Protein TonB [Nitrospira sp.]|nr:putative Protein TonB [Nitrospira sp.]
MTAPHTEIPGEWFRLRTGGWIISLCLHGSVIFLSGVLVAKLSLAPSSSSFHWDVTVIGPQRTASVPTPADAPMTSSRETSSNLRTHSSDRARDGRSVARPSVVPALPAPTEKSDPRTGHSVLTPPHSESPRAPELTPASALPLEGNSDSEQTVSQPAPSMPLETSAASQSPPPANVPLPTGDPPVFEPTATSPALPIPSQAADTPSPVGSLPPSNSPFRTIPKPDYGWLTDPLLRRIDRLKQYPASARMNHQEGRVIVRIVIEEDGRITSVAIAKSSGHDVLDQAALDTLRRASPVTLSRPLDTSPLTVQIPLNYRLGQ